MQHPARAAIGEALVCTRLPGAFKCAVCGESRTGPGKPAKKVFGPLFVDYGLLADPSTGQVCAGCVAFLGGKPSRENPPIRMGHFAVVAGEIERPDAPRMLELLRSPPSTLRAIGWTRTRQKHASLHAGECSPARMIIGTEKGPLVWRPARDARLLDAVSDLRRAARIDDIARGSYPPHTIVKLGALWGPNEAIVARYRPSLHLDMALHLVRRPTETMELPPMPAMPLHRRAARLVLGLSQGSAARKDDPIAFWSTLLLRRLSSAAERTTLTETVGRLMESLRINPLHPDVRDAISEIETMKEEESDKILSLLRSEPRQVLAMCRIIRDED